MRVMVSYAGDVQADCAAALAAYAPGAEYVQVDVSDDQSYARLIGQRWDGSSDLVLVEHDNEITAGVLPSFAACDQPWCTYEYEIFPPPWTRWCGTGLGCARFSAGLQRQFDFTGEILRACGGCGKTHAHWGTVDVLLAAGLGNLHLSPHIHGRIRHFHPYLALVPDENGEFPPCGPLMDGFKGEFRRVAARAPGDA